MPAPSSEPLRKVTLNLFAKDVEWLEQRYGRGWTEMVRQFVRRERERQQGYQRNFAGYFKEPQT